MYALMTKPLDSLSRAAVAWCKYCNGQGELRTILPNGGVTTERCSHCRVVKSLPDPLRKT